MMDKVEKIEDYISEFACFRKSVVVGTCNHR